MRIHRIIARFRVDPMLSLASPGDFFLGAGQRLHQERFHDLRATPYCIDPRRRRVVFTVMPHPETLLDIDFFNQGQFELSQRVIHVPFEILPTLIGNLPALNHPILLYNTGRCGSTALVRLLGCIGNTVGLSEPDFFAGGVGADPSTNVLDPCCRLLLDALGLTHRRVVFKLRGFGALPDEFVRQAFPEARRMFLYRDGSETVLSGIRNFYHRRGFLALFEKLARYRSGHLMARWILQVGRNRGALLSPYLADVDLKLLARAGGAGLLAVNWMSALNGARMIQESAAPLAAYHYSDLITDPQRIIRQFVTDADLPITDTELDEAVRVITERQDPHVGGRLDPAKQRPWTPTSDQERAVREILTSHPAIRSPDYRLPFTR